MNDSIKVLLSPRAGQNVSGTINLVTQTGMPPIYQSRSRELIYDALQNSTRFIKNPFGPQFLILARAQFHW